MPTDKKNEGPVPILTRAQLQSIAKRRRQKSRANPPKNPTACFYLSTPVLKWTTGGAIWMPIYKAEKDDIVIQSLPSGNIEDLSGALMAKIETVCTFGCPEEGIDIVQMGEALITAHHHIQTAESWMTARQATQQGPGRLISNAKVKRVYNLLLEGGGNIIINTTANSQEALTMTVAATMGYCIKRTKDSQPLDSPTYPQASLQRLGQLKGMRTGRKHFQVGEAKTQPNGNIILDPPLPCSKRLNTSTQAVPFNRTNPPSRFDPVTVNQLESNAVSKRTQEGDKGQPKTRPKEPRVTGLPEAKNSQSPCDADTALLEINRQPLRKLNGTNEDPLEPILTPDTYLLTTHAGKAIWTQLGTIAIGTTVVQSLPSGQTEDLGGALVTTIESICPYQRPTGEAALVRLGMACVAAYLHIKIEDEWMTALQATQRGHGTLLQEHTYPQLLSLRLQGGGNILINTSNSAVELPTLTGVVTAGYRADLSSEPKSERFITYPLHDGQAGELRAALAKPSYCDVIRHSLKEGMERQTPPVSPPVPDPTPLKSKKDSVLRV